MLLSDDWLEACNAALRAIPAAERPTLVVVERVEGAAPPQHDRVTLVADDDGVRLVAGEDQRATAWITVALDDAEALHDGSLTPPAALAAGRVRLRGDLRAVVDAMELLARAHAALRDRA